MQFSEFAAKETSAVLSRVTAGSTESSRQHLQAFRAAIEAAAVALEAATGKPVNVEGEIADLASRLTKAATGAAEAAAQRVAAEARTATDALREELETESKEKEKLAAALADTRAQAEAVAAELKDKTKELIEAGAARKKLETARAEAVAARDREAAARAGIDSELRELRTSRDSARVEATATKKRLDAATAAAARHEQALSEAQAQAQAAEAKLTAMTGLFKANAARVKALEQTDKEHQEAIEDLEAKLRASIATEPGRPAIAMLEDLLGSFQALESAETIPDVLTTFMEQLAAEFPRVALFRVKGNRLEGEHHIGFDAKTRITKVVLPLGMDSLLTRAASSGRTEQLTGQDLTDSSRAPFGGSPSCALAIPIVVHGERLGIVYADDSGQADGGADARELKRRIAEALLQHTCALLMRLTNELRNLAELRTYATSLLSEIEQMYVSDGKGGKSGEELQRRLKANLEYARSIYANRVAVECPDAASLLEEHVASVIDAQPSTPFARDLAAVALSPGDTRSAEAS